jgi:hypothetical protein
MLSNFHDSHKFKIVNMVPVFVDNGSSYLSKLKNGITLDYSIELEFFEPVIETVLVKDTNNCKQNSNLFIYDSDDNVDDDIKYNNKHSRKEKYINLITYKKCNSKKYKKILSGNNYKLFIHNYLFQSEAEVEKKEVEKKEVEKEAEVEKEVEEKEEYYTRFRYDSYDSYDSHGGYYY